MLVLSRRPNDKILFPGINATVQIVSVKGSTVRLGIDAPPDVAILRDELQDWTHRRVMPPPVQSAEERLRELRHLVRNRLNVTSIGLGLLRQRAKTGLSDDLERTIGKMEEEMQMLRQRLESDAAKAPSPPRQPARKVRKAL